MVSLLMALFREITRPVGSDGEFLSTRRKFHLLQAEWYSRIAEQGEAERRVDKAKTKPAAASNRRSALRPNCTAQARDR